MANQATKMLTAPTNKHVNLHEWLEFSPQGWHTTRQLHPTKTACLLQHGASIFSAHTCLLGLRGGGRKKSRGTGKPPWKRKKKGVMGPGDEEESEKDESKGSDSDGDPIARAFRDDEKERPVHKRLRRKMPRTELNK
jgi:hypothetical protein